MRKLLNTLYVTTPDSYLTKDGENVVVKVNDNEKFRIPIHNIEGIVCFGYLGASPGLMGMCAEKNVGLSFVSPSGKFIGRFQGNVSGNVLLRRKQYRQADSEEAITSISRIFILGKISNCRSILLRVIRDHGPSLNIKALEESITVLQYKLKSISRATSLDELRGYEGEAALAYFASFDHMILCQKDEFFFHGRNRRPPKDNVNAMLSFVYTILMHDIQSAIETVGLDPYVGFLHCDRPGRPSLALDMMEEFRPYLADRLVLSLINRKQINSHGFLHTDAGDVIMKDDTRKELITAWQKRKQEKIVHPFLHEEIPIGLLPYVQALLFARYLRGDLNNYPVFIVK
ncbi:MAG: type I-C CRISPR-associated endonuclease Cas1c [Bacteroidales bacterium]|nr:type I-C CRISPR-associated endonuclease Cas1c [Bacteroidales bacterium]HNW73213.1 type I-C CRISPR-associated endonuclease Cas1c [Bacteroidales bacterium]HPS49552.1 type I-C CRISPR-associated endonuclease Cas1c [Bacteroidales bacterium]